MRLDPVDATQTQSLQSEAAPSEAEALGASLSELWRPDADQERVARSNDLGEALLAAQLITTEQLSQARSIAEKSPG